MIEITRDGDVHIITMNDGQNTVKPALVEAINDALDKVEADTQGPGALVLTGAGKFFSSGLDVPTVMSLQGEDATRFFGGLMKMTTRLLAGPIPAVAAVNGHAFAAGAFLAMSCDFRVMREDRGWICISEVDVGVPISFNMMSILRAKLPPPILSEAVLTGKRYTGPEAVTAGFADATASEADLLGAAVARAAELATKERGIFGKLKQTLWQPEAAGLEVRG
jgi:enoyl-CoA hydratase/carnithine racemase